MSNYKNNKLPLAFLQDLCSQILFVLMWLGEGTLQVALAFAKQIHPLLSLWSLHIVKFIEISKKITIR